MATTTSTPRTRPITNPHPDPQAALEASVVRFHLDLCAMDLPTMLREELALRRQLAGPRHPGRFVVERLAAVEVRLARGGAR